ncbi:MAG: Helix-turn-helix domain [Desulfacinum sp.]|nr:Helix-turn-helix domain [Desulfacinum sp.]
MARMTVKAAAKALGVSCEVLEDYLARTGKLEEIRRGRRVFIPAEEVRALMERHRPPEEEAPDADAVPPEATSRAPSPSQTPSAAPEQDPLLMEELGRLRYQASLLERVRAELAEKDALLLEKEARIARLEIELEFLKRPWWRRMFRSLA